MLNILVLADTHVSSLAELPDSLRQLVKDADYVVHCGDFTSIQVVNDLRNLSRQFVGVYGNTDYPEVREVLPQESTLEVLGHRIAVIHPYWGGPPWGIEDELLARYPGYDVILFGHTHDAYAEKKNGTLLLNPGQGYPTFIHQPNVAVLKVTREEVSGRVFRLSDATLL